MAEIILPIIAKLGNRILELHSNSKYDPVIRGLLGEVAEVYDLDYLSIWERYEGAGDDICARRLYSWERSAELRIDASYSAPISDKTHPGVYQALAIELRTINGAVRSLPEGERHLFQNEAIKSGFAQPVVVSDCLWGFILACDSKQERQFGEAMESALETVGTLLASGYMKNEKEQQLVDIVEKMRVVEDGMELVLNSAPMSTIFWNKEYQVVDCNDETPRMFGVLDKRECIERFHTFSPETQPNGKDSAEMIIHKLSEAFENGQTRFNWQAIDANGSPLPLAITLVRVYFSDEPVVIAYAVDMREHYFLLDGLKSALAKAEAGTRAKSEFLSRMSHEIRTPLNVIIGMAKIAENSHSLEKSKYCLDKISGASRQLLSVINDVLDMSKIEAGKLSLNDDEFALEKVFENTCNIIAIKAEEKHQALIADVDHNLPSLVIGDETRLMQVLTNLLYNAIKFTDEQGTIKLKVKNEGIENDRITLKISVTDNGIGITKEQQERLFSSFEQADGGISRKYGGTGLGLAISKKIVELMGGHIHIESAPGVGSSFIFTIKLKVSENAVMQGLRKNIKVKNLRVLVVDDSVEIREYFERVMESFHIECDGAESGYQAIEMMKDSIIARRPYNAVFVDWKMPEMNGIETSMKIRELAGQDPLVIMISVAEWTDIKDRAKQAGIERFIQKPLFSSAILDIINEIFDGKSEAAADEKEDYTGAFLGSRVLLVEDVDINREIFISLTEETGLAVECAENGEEAVEMFSIRPDDFDLILMDIHMPVMDGYEATQTIRALPMARAREIPIIAMTANAFREDVERCKSFGMNDHIAKPIEADIVYRKLMSFLKKQKERRKAQGGEGGAGAVAGVGAVAGADKYSSWLPDIDVASGVKRMMGKEKPYLSLLKKFNADGYLSQLENVAGMDAERLAALFHTIKGVAANLSLMVVFELAKGLEMRVKSGDSEVDVGELMEGIRRVRGIVDEV